MCGILHCASVFVQSFTSIRISTVVDLKVGSTMIALLCVIAIIYVICWTLVQALTSANTPTPVKTVWYVCFFLELVAVVVLWHFGGVHLS